MAYFAPAAVCSRAAAHRGDYSAEQWDDLPACLFFFFFYITRLIPWNACALPPCTSSHEEEHLNSSEILNARADAPPAKEFATTNHQVSSHFIFTVVLCERGRREQRAESRERPYPSCRGGTNRTRQSETVPCASLSPPAQDGPASPCTRSERDRRRTSSASTSPGASPNERCSLRAGTPAAEEGSFSSH